MVFREIDDDLREIVQEYLPPPKPHIGRPRRDPRGLINGILYVLTTGCSWLDVPARYGTKSTVHRYHLELCAKGVYQVIFFDLLRSGYEIKKIDLLHCATDTRDIKAKNPHEPLEGTGIQDGNCISIQKGDRPAMMAIKR